MHSRSLILTFFLSVFLTPGLVAQEKGGLVHRLLEKIRTPDRRYDAAYIYQPAPRWHVDVTSGIRRAGVSQENRFVMFYGLPDEEGTIILTAGPATLETALKGDFETTVGLSAGYGGLAGSFSRTLGKDKSHSNTTFSFDLMMSGVALQLQYFNFSQPMEYALSVENAPSLDVSGTTDNPGRMRALIADVFYTFRRHRFDYSAVYKGGKIQRKSAGSWMFGTKVILGETRSDPDEFFTPLTWGVVRQSTAQVSFGGGFSYNWVPYHRQPYGAHEQGLRNLTANVTFLPMVTLFNQFTSTYYMEVDGEMQPWRKVPMNGNLLVNYVARAGLCYSFGRYQANLSAAYDSYSYHGTTHPAGEGPSLDTVETGGRFERWTVTAKFGVKF